jgi:ribosomal protein S6
MIFGRSVKEDDRESVLGKISDEVTRLGGRVLSSQVLGGKRVFARPLHGREAGIYGRLALCLDPDAVAALLSRLKLNEDVFRIQIVRNRRPPSSQENAGTEEAVEESAQSQ